MATGDSFTDVEWLDLQDYGCKIIWTNFLSSCLMQIVSNPKINLSESLSVQFVCNQGNHPLVKTGHR